MALLAVGKDEDAAREFRRGLEIDPAHLSLREALTSAMATRR